ncbi:hypothetical protein HOY80DRAFT_169662 [Tuber brumale]|nr:hypothetical protein HOY80DRAFT_169662 [Tuber brumale]
MLAFSVFGFLFLFLFSFPFWPRGVCVICWSLQEKENVKEVDMFIRLGSDRPEPRNPQLFAATFWTRYLIFSDATASYHPYHHPTAL